MLDTILRPVSLPSSLIGKPAPCDFFDARGTLLLREGGLINLTAGSADQGRRLFCRAAQAARVSNVDPLRTLHDVGECLSMLDELVAADRLVSAGEFIDLSRHCYEAWRLDPDACIGFARLARFDRPSVCHSVLVALFAAELGEAHGFGEAELIDLIGAALTMNLGSMRMHDTMNAQDGRLDADTREALAAHPAWAERLLGRIGGFSEAWLLAVAQHHENLDGSGYPLGLMRAEISLPGRMLRVADVLAARLQGRKRRTPQYWSLQKARDREQLIRHVFGEDLERLDHTLVRMLMGRLGAFPPGSLVRLSNGEMAIINRRQGESGGIPQSVLSVTDANGKVQAVPRARAIGSREHKIMGYAHDDQARIPTVDWQPLWGYRH